jgi:dihydropteroate synthase
MLKRKQFRLRLPSRTLLLGERTLVMAVLNVTPDSFSDGGKFFNPRAAVKQALAMEREGADLIDIGAESTRPGSREIPVEEELGRLLPVLEALRGKLQIPISIDTQKAVVAEAAVRAGAEIINDVSGLRHDDGLAEVAENYKVPLILMHMRGEPRTMQKIGFARNVVKDVLRGLRASVATARKFGVVNAQILLDPGIGFGKSWRQNYELLARLEEIGALGFPVVIGTSRKGFLGSTLARGGKSVPSGGRIWGTAGTVAAGISHGAHIVRVHDVAEMAQVARVADCVLRPELAPKN